MFPTQTGFYILLAIFISVIGIGEATLIPGVYISYVYNLEIWMVLIAALAGSILSDSFWFLIGRYFPKEKLGRALIIKREMKRAETLRPLYEKHKLRTVFFSKFMYGTTIFFQVLAGANHIKYSSYILTTTLATLVWFTVSVIVGVTLGSNISLVKDFIVGVEVVITLSFVACLMSLLFVRRLIKRKRFSS